MADSARMKTISSRHRSRKVWKQRAAGFCDRWLLACNRSDKTIKAYRTDLKQFIRDCAGTFAIGKLRRESIESWIAQMQEQQFEASTIRRKIAAVRTFFGYLEVQDPKAVSPLRGLRLRLGAAKRLTRVVSCDDVNVLVRLMDRAIKRRRGLSTRERFRRKRDGLIVRLLLVTGIRVGELVSIKISDLCVADRTILIFGKGRRERLAFVADPDTGDLLDKYLIDRKSLFSTSDALLVNHLGQPLVTDNVRYIIKTWTKAAVISNSVTPHMLRHTAATRLLENGADLRIVQVFLGHGSIRSTERYTQVTARHFQRELRKANPLRCLAS